jgi:choline trimethylamine-lyase
MDRKTRVSRLREAVYSVPQLCMERALLMTQSYKENESDPPVLKRAKALEKILREMSIRIEPEELIVGRATSKRVGGPLVPEVQWQWYLAELDSMSSRETDKLQPWTEEDKAKVREIVDYWKGKSLSDKWHSMVPKDYKRFENVLWEPGGANPIMGFHLAHCCPDFERILVEGLNGIRKQVDGRLDKLDLTDTRDFERSTFLKAVRITLDAVAAFAGRYAELADDLAEKEADPRRKVELNRIAEACAWVPAKPARSFYEAMQSLWFSYIAVMLEAWGPGIGFGRVDQYLYPFYRRDMDEGRITREEARELISLFYLKLNELVMPFALKTSRGSGQIPLSGITLGGVTRDRRDGVNELSFLFLEAEEDVRLQEDLVVRVHAGTSELFLMKACEIAKLVKGKIKFVSDETIVQQLLNDGKPIEYARDYAITGCFIRTVPGRSSDTGGDFLNLPLALELALNNGVSRMTGDRVGPATGDPRAFTSYEDVWNAYARQAEALLRQCIVPTNLYRQLFAEFTPTPLQSALFEGCIDRGLDLTNGGVPHTTLAMWVAGIPDVGDSLAAVKKVVFDDRQIAMKDLIEALDNNFEGKEGVLRLLTNAPKFGNDDDYVDSITAEVLVHAANELRSHTGFAGLRYGLAAGSIRSHITFGNVVGALPSGRKAGESLSDGGISPCQGRNVRGPTSTMRSVAKLDLVKSSGGAVLNMKFNPDVLNEASKIRKLALLIRTFCETGGDLVQFNIVGSGTLKDAQKNPEKYRDLLVRVATYSAYFVDLGQELQDQIIARTEFQEV